MRRAVIVQGLGFGDEGKGTIVDALVREIGATMVVRYNGGAQAAHRVVLDNGKSHVFSQFGSGTLAGAGTYLSRHVMVEPFSMMNEADTLSLVDIYNPLGSVWIDAEAPIITPYHRALNRLREWSRSEPHGSCGMGIGELRSDMEDDPTWVFRAKHLHDPDATRIMLGRVFERLRGEALKLRPLLPDPNRMDVSPELHMFEVTTLSLIHTERLKRWVLRYKDFAGRVQILQQPVDFRAHQNIVFEGAQGVLLDELYGFHPYTTWSNCTFGNAISVLQEGQWKGTVTKIGVTRAYATRHGVGPFPTEDATFTVPAEAANHEHPFQGSFRVGHLDGVLLRYAIACCDGIDGLAMTHLDVLEMLPHIALATRYRTMADLPVPQDYEDACRLTVKVDKPAPFFRAFLGEHRRDNFLMALQNHLKVAIAIESFGPTATAKRWTPQWRHLAEKVTA